MTPIQILALITSCGIVAALLAALAWAVIAWLLRSLDGLNPEEWE